MNLFDTVKDAISTRQAAEFYGLSVNNRGMCVCPFHRDSTPSMKVDRRFHCFSCQADGDVIDFVARLRGVSKRKALQTLCVDFGITPVKCRRYKDSNHHRTVPEDKRKEYIRDFWFGELSGYHDHLKEWRAAFEPDRSAREWNPRFYEALTNIPVVENDLDILLSGSESDKNRVIDECRRRRKELYRMDSSDKTPVYYRDFAYAAEHGETDIYRESYQKNIECKRFIESEIKRCFDGMHLKKECVLNALNRYGPERVEVLLAATVRQKYWDGRFSKSSRDWAFSSDIPECGTADKSSIEKLSLPSHPAVLDGFIGMFREEMRVREMNGRTSVLSELKRPVKPADRITERPAEYRNKEVKKHAEQLSR